MAKRTSTEKREAQLEEEISRVLAAAPALTKDQINRLSAAFRGTATTGGL